MNNLYIMHYGVNHKESTPGSGRYRWGTKIVQTASASKNAQKQFESVRKTSESGTTQTQDIERELRGILSRRAYEKFKKNEKKYMSGLTTQQLEDYVRRKRAEDAYVSMKIQDDPGYNKIKTGENYISSLGKIGATSLALSGSIISTIIGIKILSGT